MRALLVLSGPPGAGKTTIAKLLARAYDRAAHINADDFWRYIASGYVEPWLPESKEQNGVVMSAVAAAASRFVDGGYDTIVDGVVGPWFLDTFLHIAAAPWGLDYVVLRPREEVAVGRATRRRRADLTDESPVRKMYREFADLGDLERHAIDSSALSPEATAARVLAGLRERKFTVA